jgi:hypothetical protein
MMTRRQTLNVKCETFFGFFAPIKQGLSWTSDVSPLTFHEKKTVRQPTDDRPRVW